MPSGTVLLVSLLFATIPVLLMAPNPLTVDGAQLSIMPDDAMRLVQARDFFHGQGWFDLHQHRLGAANAAPMHWSRVIDLPLALLMAIFTPWVGEKQAVLAAAVVWPMFCTYLYVLASGAIGAWVAGRRGLVCVGFIAAIAVYFAMRPGRVDYHYVQTILMMTTALLLLPGGGRAGKPALAAALACLSLSIGLEELPVIIVVSAVMAVRWAFGGGDARRQAIAFLAVLALGTPLAMVLTVPPAQRLVGWCDALSIVYVTVIVLGAGISALAAWIIPSEGYRAWRIAALAVAVAVPAAVVLRAYPECLAGPYAQLDPETMDWIRHRMEARNFVQILGSSRAMPIYMLTVWPLVGLAGLALGAWTAPAGRRPGWLVLGAVLVTGWAISLSEFRGTNSSLPFSAFGAAYLMASVSALPGLVNVLKPALLVAIWLTQTPFPTLLVQLPGGKDATALGAKLHALYADCIGEKQMAPVAALPPGRVATSIEFGSYVLLRTPHWVLGSPHHRNYAGNLAAIRLAKADRKQAYRILRHWRIDYVLVCDRVAYAPWSGVDKSSGPGAEAERPSWLKPLPSVEPLRIFRFVPG